MDLSWPPDPLALLVLLGPTLFVVHHAFLSAERLGGGVRGVAASKLWGAFLFGLVPPVVLGALEINPVAVGLRLPSLLPFIIVVGVAGLLILPLVAAQGRKDAAAGVLPQLHRRRMSPEFVVASAGILGIYLLGYEYLFRGLLLTPLVDAWGVWPGLAVSTGLYALAHLHKGPAELVGSLPMGLVFGLMALYTGSIWAPWALHVAIALVHETTVARHAPGLRWWVSPRAGDSGGRTD